MARITFVVMLATVVFGALVIRYSEGGKMKSMGDLSARALAPVLFEYFGAS